MFGDNSRIKSLEAKVGQLEHELENLQPWVDLAKTLREETARFAVNTDVETAVNLALQSAGEEERHNFILASYNQLSPERQIEILVTTFDDGILKDALDQERQKRIEEAGRLKALSPILEEAQTHRRLHFPLVPDDSNIIMYFYAKENLEATRLQPLNWNNFSRRIEGKMDKGKVTVHDDKLSSEFKGSDHLLKYRDHYRISIRNPNDYNGALYYGTLVDMPRNHRNDGLRPSATLGPVFINGVDIFNAVPDNGWRRDMSKPSI